MSSIERPQRTYNAAVIVTSDTCHKDPAKDESGLYVETHLKFMDLFDKITKLIVKDDQQAITECVRKTLVDNDPALIITVGGTGLCPRDVTPEATSVLYDKHCSGIVCALQMTSLRYTALAALSRLTAGITGSCLIVNFPGSLKACKDCLKCLEGFLEHALEQVRFDSDAYKETHRVKQLNELNLGSSSNQSQCQRQLSKAPGSERVGKVSPVHEPSSTTVGELVAKLSLTASAHSTSAVASNTTGPSLMKATTTKSIWEKSDNDEIPCQQQPSTTSNNSISTNLLTNSPNLVETTRVLPNESPYPLIDYENALEIMGTLSYSLLDEIKHVDLSSLAGAYSALGDVVASDLKSKTVIPSYSVSTMDGYVMNIPSTMRKMIPNIKSFKPKLLANLEEFKRYQNDKELSSRVFFCYQINTGGRLPEKDFLVVPTERAGPLTVDNLVPIQGNLKEDQFIRGAGSDICTSDVIEAGTVIGPVELSLIMSMGLREVQVFRKPLLGILSTGDELVEADEYFSKWQAGSNIVLDTNGPLLSSLLKGRGFNVESSGISRDNPKEILLLINNILEKCDILLITGGASMGTKDHVKDVIEQIGGIIHFGRVNIKPGKPVSFSSTIVGKQRKFIFSLPGNPVSAYITCLVLVIPFIEHGLRNHFGPELPLTIESIGDLISVEIERLLDEDATYNFDGRLEFARAKISPTTSIGVAKEDKLHGRKYYVTVSLKQQSSRIFSLKDCDCLIIVDPSQKGSRFLVGQTYQALRLNKR